MAQKRAPGGGRKPSARTPRAQLTIRMPDDMREELELAARDRDWTLTDELLLRLRVSFHRERDESRQPGMRALCFLIAELADHIVGPSVARGKSEFRFYSWRSDPFFYRAFKIAVGRLLDALEPSGPIKVYQITANEAELEPYMKHYLSSFKTPEARAEYSVEYILTALREAPHQTAERREEQRKLVGMHPALMREFYGMPDAASDLVVEPRSGETMPLTVDVAPVFFGGEKPKESKPVFVRGEKSKESKP
jgi:hypothetical protein